MDIYVVTIEQAFACSFRVLGVALTMEEAQVIAGGGEWRVDEDGDATPVDMHESERIYRFSPNNDESPPLREGSDGRSVLGKSNERESTGTMNASSPSPEGVNGV